MNIKLKVKDIASILNLEYKGDGEKVIKRISSIENSTSDSIIFIENKDFKNVVCGCVISRDFPEIYQHFPCVIISKDPKYDFFRFVSLVIKEERKPFISPKAIIRTSHISENVYIGDFVTIEEGAKISEGVVIENGSYIGKNSVIMDNTFIYPYVVIRENVYVGRNCIIHSNTVIGSDGFGYLNRDGKHFKIPQIGGVKIGDDVEIGSSVCIDRATLDWTEIGDGTKIDNLVHIAHNVKVGKNCIILAQAGIAGSTIIEDNVIIAGQAGISDHLRIGSNSIIMAQSGVIGNIEKGSVVFGTPARDRGKYMRIEASLSRLPEIYKYFLKKMEDEKK